VAAKTGTAETVVHDDGTDAARQRRPHSWFEAFAPFDQPRIAVVILVEHAGEGAQYAAPAAREVLAWYFTQGAGSK
jgi:penicillin-binding protein 2